MLLHRFTTFEFPALRKGNNYNTPFVAAQDDTRRVTVGDYTARSCFAEPLRHFDRFLIRAASRKPALSGILGNAMQNVANKVNATGVSEEHVLQSCYSGSACIDTVHGDLYRLLMRRPLTLRPEKQNTVLSAVFAELLNSDEFRQATIDVNGNPISALRAATAMVESLFNSPEMNQQLADESQKESDSGDGGEEQQDDAGESDADDGTGQTAEENSDGQNEQDADSENGDDQQGEGDGESEGEGDTDESANGDSSDSTGEENGENEGEGDGKGEGANGDEADSGEGEGAGDAGNESGSGDGGQDSDDTANQSGDSTSGDEEADGDSGTDTAPVEINETPPEAPKEAINNMFRAMAAALKSSDGEAGSEAERLTGLLAGNNAGVHDTEDLQMVNMITNIVDNYFQGNRGGNYRFSLENIYALLGRTEHVLGEAITASKHGDGEVVDITQGGDPTRMLPSEFISLCLPELESVYYTRMAEEQLLQTERHGVDDSGQGPLIIMVDVSGSTGVSVKFQGVETALPVLEYAFACSLAAYGRKWHRPVAIIPFDNSAILNRAYVNTGTRQASMAATRASLENCISCYSGGGTNFVNVLEGAAELFAAMPQFESADIIFFTDGYGSVSSAQAQRIKQVRDKLYGVRIFGLAINVDGVAGRHLREVETSNSILFDCIVATRMNELEDGMRRLFTAIVERSFYAVERS